jgi:peptidoglycan/LPS O-acetylase OafA/YrhL
MTTVMDSRPRATSVRFVETWASVYFDSLRAVAAFLVMFGHWRNILFIDYPQIQAHRLAWILPYLVAGVGHQAVIFFFVLSGYFIGGTILRALERDRWQWSEYLVRRFVRLWIVLIPALLLCLFWDKLGIHLGHAPALYGGKGFNHIIAVDVSQHLSPRVFFGNLFFLQTILVPTLGTDGPLWSLANEFWYYLLFPLGVIALWPRARWVHRLACAVLFLAAAWFVRGVVLLSFPIWLGGVFLFKLPTPSFSENTAKALRIIATLIYLPIFLVIGRIHLNAMAADYVLAALTLGYLWILLSAQNPHDPKAFTARISREGARFSYTLYAAHLPFLILGVSLLAGDSRWYPSPSKILLGLGLVALVVIYAYGLAYFTEFRTDGVRMRLERLLGLVATPSALPSDPVKDGENARVS